MPKSSKRFILSSEKLNSHGFVVITSGIDIADFLKNPIMYWLHNSPTESDPTEGMPIGYWTDIEFNDRQLTGIPVFNDSDDFAMKIYNMVEHGTLRAASIEVCEPVVLDTNKSNWVPGQTNPTVLKCKLGEASIVDRGSNADATVLSNDSSRSVYVRLIQNAITGTRDNIPQNNDSNTSSQENNTDEHTPEIKAIFKNAVEAGKFTQPEITRLAKLTTNDPDILSAMKNIIKKTPIKPENIEGKYHHALIKQAAESTYDDILRHVSGGLDNLKKNAPELFKAKFFEKFGRLPGDVA